MNILLVNVHSSRNAGDAALTEVALQRLEEIFPGCQLTLSIDDPLSHTGSGRPIPSIFTWVVDRNARGEAHWNLLKLIWLLPALSIPVLTHRLRGKAAYWLTPRILRDIVAAYIAADLVVSKPGGFLYSSGRGIALALGVLTMALALWLRKPVYIFPQSIGPLRRRWEHRLVGWLLERVRVVMLREAVSLDVVRRCGVTNPHLVLLPDMAFAYQAAAEGEARQWLRLHGIPIDSSGAWLGVTLINWEAINKTFLGQAAYEAAVAAAGRTFITQTSGKLVLFSQVCGPLSVQDDRIPARRVAASLSAMHGSVFVVEDPMPAKLLKAAYGLMDLFIGSRMHSNIFALSQGLPVIAIGYQHKTVGIAQMAGISEWVFDISDVNESELSAKLIELWEKRQEVRAQITQKVSELVAQLGLIDSLVLDDYRSLGGGKENA